ncbi:hypothetical protein BB561_006943, partial [Smittium simulii]
MQNINNNFFAKSTKNKNKIILDQVQNKIAPQVKAIKYITKPNKLQTLELNNKN